LPAWPVLATALVFLHRYRPRIETEKGDSSSVLPVPAAGLVSVRRFHPQLAIRS
jgi:hypothetical protein